MNGYRHFQNQKQNFKYKNIATKNIHSEEAREYFKGRKIAEGFSPASSVSLTGLLKILSELQKDVSKSHIISPPKRWEISMQV